MDGGPGLGVGLASAAASVVVAFLGRGSAAGVRELGEQLTKLALRVTASEAEIGKVSTSVSEIRTYVTAEIAAAKQSFRAVRQQTGSQSALQSPTDLAKLIGLDDVIRRVVALEGEQREDRESERQRQREMGEVMAMLRILSGERGRR